MLELAQLALGLCKLFGIHNLKFLSKLCKGSVCGGRNGILEMEAQIHRKLNRVGRQELDLDLMTVEYYSEK